MSHRVKNSLTSVVGLLRVQARGSESGDVKHALENAAMRVASIAEVHDHLWRGSKVGFVDLSDFVGHLCRTLQSSAPEFPSTRRKRTLDARIEAQITGHRETTRIL
jgi:two-component sensor histidine kinase